MARPPIPLTPQQKEDLKAGRKIRWSKPSKRRDGKLGARASVHIVGANGADGHYAVMTHGLTSAQVAERIARIEAFHAERSKRLARYRGLQQVVEFNVGTDVYRLVDLTIQYPDDASHCRLYMDVRRVGVGNAIENKPVAGFPIRKLYGSPAEIPVDAVLFEMIRAALPDVSGMQAAHEEFVAKVSARIAK